RVKSTIEVRGADACPLPLALSGIAMWTGFLYDPDALSAAEALGQQFAELAPIDELFDAACKDGLQAEVGQPFLRFARELLEISRDGLTRYQPDSVPLLKPLDEVLEAGQSPGRSVLDAWSTNSAPDAFLKAVAYTVPS
ncbi:MAG: glutamate--cysteine ligase, partial [Myxococcota bacterium]|nr:glutamate--cysteine ligase [Myxococcota bacterium]